jgi:nitroimidazol reductase NimA-like FMN-containing flavoprotein (pyridoxamine 5'-phosphate oxidase superfamily)
MFRELRRKEKKMSEEETLEVLKNGQEGVLATLGADGYPYAVPLNYACHNGNIYFHCAKTGHKIDNLAHHTKVSFCVVADAEIIPEKFSTRFKSVIAFGTAAEVFDGEKEAGLLALVQRYSCDYIAEGKKYIASDINKTKVFKIEIEHMTGKATR